jgi:hypothetical protein
MAAFWAVFTFGGSGPALTAHGSLDLKQEIQIQIQSQHGNEVKEIFPSYMYVFDSTYLRVHEHLGIIVLNVCRVL